MATCDIGLDHQISSMKPASQSVKLIVLYNRINIDYSVSLVFFCCMAIVWPLAANTAQAIQISGLGL